jgi:hypothetical protein
VIILSGVRWSTNQIRRLIGIPNRFLKADLGAILTGRQQEVCRSWPNQTEVTVPGIHYIREDSPGEIGAAIAVRIREFVQSSDDEGRAADAHRQQRDPPANKGSSAQITTEPPPRASQRPYLMEIHTV